MASIRILALARSLTRNRGGRAGLLATALLGLVRPAAAQTISLYQNDFETPNVPTVQNCGFALDQRGINFLYGSPQGTFQQTYTVEAVLIDFQQGGQPFYSDPSGIGGDVALGMLAAVQDDHLALTFDSQGRDFINVGMDISSIDVQGCGGPFGIGDVEFNLSLVDSPGGVFSFGAGTTLDSEVIVGRQAPGPYIFTWTNHVVVLDTSGSVDGKVTIVWDLVSGSGLSNYAAFDNLVITASDTPGDLDTTPPTLSCPPVVSVLDPKSSAPGEVVFYTVSATDDFDPAPVVVCSPPPGSHFPRGTTLVTCIATDASGNQSTCTFPVVVMPTIRENRL